MKDIESIDPEYYGSLVSFIYFGELQFGCGWKYVYVLTIRFQ